MFADQLRAVVEEEFLPRAPFVDCATTFIEHQRAHITIEETNFFKFAELMLDQDAWREIVATSAKVGIPAPAFSSSLAYYDGLRAERLPAALIQGQRDFFGAHTYRRIDKEGTFHTLWSGDRTEIEAEDTH